MAVVHLTGDTSLLAPLRERISQGAAVVLDDDTVSALRETAARILDAEPVVGAARTPLPATDTLIDMMSVCAGELIAPEYVPMLLDEAVFDDDLRSFSWCSRPSADILDRFHVLVIGAGMSGICAAIRLREAGIPFTVVDRNDDVGGTWLENRYPGCGVDTPNHLYSYSFAPNPAWPRYFSKRDEILDYFRTCADEYGVLEHTRFGTEVARADYVKDTQSWSVELRDRSGAVTTMRANVVVSAVGMLNRPRMPDLVGMSEFTGDLFHSARWPDGLDITGKRVAIIGTGASAIQLGPTIANDSAEVRVFQRSAPWVIPDGNYHRDVSPEAQWLFEHLPYYASWYRFRLLWMYGDRVHSRLTHGGNELQLRLLAHLSHELCDRDDLFAATTPTIPPYGKRMLVDNHWFSFLRREDVRLVTAPIERLDRSGIVTCDGEHHDADVIVFATGFDATTVMGSVDLHGRSGRSLREQWGDNARAYLGITVPDYPNLFCLYGPNTNLAFGGSAIFHSECQVSYLMGCLRLMLEGGWRSLECRAEVCDEYNERVDDANNRMPWGAADVENWFKNSAGRVVTNSPWRMVDYWSWTREPDPADYVMERG